ncbi:MAG: sugar nucleotide-binding protein, partial [Christiangramia sp.]|nr:sugar nucleotide-binding protein [Christiangramia sp.]
MNILVTGSNGQLGSEIRFIAPDFKNFNFFFTDLAELNISNKQAIEDYVGLHEIEAIINCAAYTAVDKAESEPELADLINHI